jgi:ABC-type Na+ efflux pump permease subunit
MKHRDKAELLFRLLILGALVMNAVSAFALAGVLAFLVVIPQGSASAVVFAFALKGTNFSSSITAQRNRGFSPGGTGMKHHDRAEL